MTPEEQSKFEQGVAMLGDTLPPLWWRLYCNCKEQGFTEEQAMLLLRTHIAQRVDP